MPIQFTPASSVYKDQLCRGVHILVTDREACKAVDVGLLIAETLYRWYPKDFDVEKIEHLLLNIETLAAIKSGKSLQEIHAVWKRDIEEFMSRRAKYLIYR